MRNFTLFLLGTSILVLPACGGDPAEATTTDSSTGGASTGTTDPTTSTTGVGDTTTGGSGTSETSPTTTGEPETTSTSTTSEPGTTTTEGTTSGTTEPVNTTTTEGTTTDGTTTDGTTTDGTTGEPVVCDGLQAMACMANDACMPLGGGKLNLQKMCVSKPMFLGCVDAGACGGALTYACESAVEPPEPYLFPSTCLPEGWEPCEAPPIEMPCK